MKRCSHCNKTYDDSWSVCLNCESPLDDIGTESNPSQAPKPRPISLGENFIQKEIDRTNRNLILTNVAVVLGAIYLCYAGLSEGSGWWTLIVVGVGVLGAWNLLKAWKRKKNPLLHPIRVTIGKIGPQNEVEAMINKEVQASTLKRDSMVLTRSWFIKTSAYGADISLLGELAWTYRKVTQRSVNFIPAGKDYSVLIYKRDGNCFEISCGEQESTRIQEVVMKSAPWVIGGYSDELKNLWDYKKSEFLAAVDQRRRESKESKVKMRGDGWVAPDGN